MGAPIPEYDHLKISHNIDYNEVKEQLSSGGQIVQFDASKIREELNNIDSSDFSGF